MERKIQQWSAWEGIKKDVHVVDRRNAASIDIENDAHVVDRRDQVAVEVDVNEVDKRAPV